jgi:putative cardiolipin synthase
MTAFEDPMSTRLGQFFGPAAAAHPGLSGFDLLSRAREAFIVRLALADLAERSLDMQYYVWDGDTTGRIIVDRVMKAADRGVRVRLLVDDPFYNKASDPVKAALDAHPNVEIRLFNATTEVQLTSCRLPPVQPPHAQQLMAAAARRRRRRPQYR